MRQFVFGVLVAAGLWFGYRAVAEQAVAEQPAARPENASALLQDVHLADGHLAGGHTPASTPLPAPATAALQAVTLLDASDVDRAWVALALGEVKDRAALVTQLQPRATGVAATLTALGSHNAFLHSAEGRAMALSALQQLHALPDAERCTAGTQLLNLCLRGRIELSDGEARTTVNQIYRSHREVVDRWLCDPANVTRARSHTIEPNRGLAVVASRFRKEGLVIEAGTIALLNRIKNPNRVQVGQQIKIPVDPVHAVLEKRSFGFALYLGDALLRLYWVGHGKDDKTPVTEFTVVAKQAHPEWTAPNGKVYPYGHPENILGEYFLKFQHGQYRGFGAHGTTQPETIGTMSSAGCIRLHDEDIAELFAVFPQGGKIEVRANEWRAAR